MSTDPNANKIDEIKLDMTLDDIEDLPQYIQLPTGAYAAKLENGIIAKTIPAASGDQPVFELAFTITSVAEVDPKNLDEGEDMPKPGDIGTFAFQRDNKFGMGIFKEVAKPIAQQLGTSQIGALLEGSKGMEVMLIIERKYNKEKQKNYSSIKKLMML